MAKKRGRLLKTTPTTPSSSTPHAPVLNKENEERGSIPFDLLAEEGIVTDAVDELDEQQTKALMMNLDRLREKLKGKKPLEEPVAQESKTNEESDALKNEERGSIQFDLLAEEGIVIDAVDELD
ncbi:hypothetical protein RIF29_20426 [Crotalaria pallida]|uniref:Uncharacterized protein n=1 Tax=Crotalaria pallida TaxID=3830 RepID=A0AAN9F1J3_CROPI